MKLNRQTQEVTMSKAQAEALFGLMGIARHFADFEVANTSIRLAVAALSGLEDWTELKGDESPAILLGALESELAGLFLNEPGVGGQIAKCLDNGIKAGLRRDLTPFS